MNPSQTSANYDGLNLLRAYALEVGGLCTLPDRPLIMMASSLFMLVHSRLEVYVPFLVIRRLGVISMSLMVVYRPTYNLLQMFVSSLACVQIGSLNYITHN